MSRQHDDARDLSRVPGDDAGSPDAPGEPDESWLETKRWLDEWGDPADSGATPGEDVPPGQLRPSETWWSPEPDPDPAAASATVGEAEPGTAPVDDPAAGGRHDDAGRDSAEQPQEPPGGWPPGYVPPSSPAYSPRTGAPQYFRSRPGPGAVPAPAELERDPMVGLTDQPLPPPSHRAGQLLFLGLAIVFVMVAAAALLTLQGDKAATVYTFGEVTDVSAGTTVQVGDEQRELAVGDAVEAGSVVQAPTDGAVAIDLGDRGVVRFDSGARLAFLDDSADPQTGASDGDSAPAIEVATGRAWINPADGAGVTVRVTGGAVTTGANPVAVECAGECSIEAPAGGATIDSDSGSRAQPVAGEVVTVRADTSLALGDGTQVTPWAQQNLDADGSAGLAEPEPGDELGVRASAVLDGSYPFRIDVVGDPQGDTLPSALVYSAGETYSLTLGAAGSACPPVACDVAVTAAEGASGSARVADGTVTLSFAQQIDCYDESYTSVVVPGIGSTTVQATATVGGVIDDNGRWRISSFAGTGTISTTLETRCNDGDTLGTSTSATTVTGG